MDTILQGIPHVICYIDDILVTGATEEEHLCNLEAVLEKLKKHGIRAKKEKCLFLQDKVEYLGHVLDAEGLHASDSKVEAVLKVPNPKNVKELRSFLGMMNYYRKFIPSLATILKPLTSLLEKNHKWAWNEECVRAFEKAKALLTSSPVLVHYDPKLPMRMAADASAYGVGAVISHVFPNGEEKPIFRISNTISYRMQLCSD